jgi:organic hydroperoxide reductase OsmC/OhrA
MSKHQCKISWIRESKDFSYENYNRSHNWQFENGLKVEASSAPAFLGSADRVDPEEAFVASLSSCHMLTFLAICARKRITVDSYQDSAIGYLAKNEQGKFAITKVVLSPEISFAGETPCEKTLKKIHERSHHECFIANSVKTEIVIGEYISQTPEKS